MAFQPSPRPAGSTQVLKFSGAIIQSLNTPLSGPGAFPKQNGEYPAGFVPAPGSFVGVRFLLGDATDPDDTTRRLPGFVFDDTTPAATQPSAPTFGAIPNVLGPTDEIITTRTWAQNTYVTIEPRDAASAAILTGVNLSGVQVVLDTATSGLGLDTGLPVLVIPVELSAATPFDVDILIEVRHTASR